MEEVRKKLTVAERAFLSNLWQDKDKLHALRIALSHRQLWLAQFIAGAATDFDQVMKTRGQIEESNWFISFLEHNFKELDKAKKAAESTTTA